MPNNPISFKDLVSQVPASTSTIGNPVGASGYGTSKYDKPVNYQDALYSLDDFRHNNQGNLDIIGNSLAHLTGSAISAAAEIPAMVYGVMTTPIKQWHDIYEGKSVTDAFISNLGNVFDNEMSRNIVDPINNWFQNEFKVYQSSTQSQAPFFSIENLASGHTLDMLASGAGYTIGSILTGAALTKVFGLAKLGAEGKAIAAEGDILEVGNKAARTVMPLDVQKQMYIGTLMAGMESSQQVRSDGDENREIIKKQHPELSDEEINIIVKKRQLFDFAFNMAILAPTDVMLVKNWWRPNAKSFLSSAEVNIPKDLGEISLKAGPKTFGGKALNVAKKVATSKPVKGFIFEGGQEGLQFAAQKGLEDYTNRRISNPDGSAVLDALYGMATGLYDALATKEGAENWFTGGIIGMLGAAPATVQEASNTKANKDYTNKQIAFFNKDIPHQNEVLRDKMLDANRVWNYANSKDEHLVNKKQFDYYNDSHSFFVALVQQHINNGTIDLLKARIKSLYGAKTEDINNFFGNQVTKENIDEWKPYESLKDIEDEIDHISKTDIQIKRLVPNPYNPKKNPKEYTNFRQLQNLFVHTATTIDNTNQRIEKLNGELIKLGAVPFDVNTYINLTQEEKGHVTKELTDHNESHLNPKDLADANEIYQDIINLKVRHEAFKIAYKQLESEKGKAEQLSKISKQNETPLISEEKKPEVPEQSKPSIPAEKVDVKEIEEVDKDFPTIIKKQGTGEEVNVKKTNIVGEYVDKDGKTYNLNTDSSYYVKGETQILKGKKEEIKGVNQPLRLHKTRLADDKLKQKLNPDFTSESIEFDNDLQEILSQAGWQNRTSFIISKGKPSDFILEDKPTELKGRSGEINIILQLDNGKKNFQVENPDKYTLNGKTIAFAKLKEWGNTIPSNVELIDNVDKFNKYFSKEKQQPFTKDEFKEFQNNWLSLKEFNDSLIKYFASQSKGEDIPVPEGVIESIVSGTISFSENRVPLESIEIFKDAPIRSNSSPTVNINNVQSLSDDPPIQKSELFRNSYYALARLANGIKRWIRIIPKTVQSKDVLGDLQRVKKELYDLSPTEITKEKTKAILDSMDFFIAVDPNIAVIPYSDSFGSDGKAILSIAFGKTNPENGSLEVIKRSPLTVEALTSLKELIKFINIEGVLIDPKVTEKSFKKDIKKSNNVKNSDFEIQVNPEIMKDLTMLFNFRLNKMNLDILPKESTYIAPSEIKTKEEVKSEPAELDKYPGLKEYLESIPEEDREEAKAEWIKDVDLQTQIYNLENGNLKTKLVTDESQITTSPLTWNEAIDRLYEQLPSSIPAHRLETILHNTHVNGILLGAFFNNAVYLGERIDAGVVDHEAFHGVFNLVLTPEEQRRYLNAKKQELQLTLEQLQEEINELIREIPERVKNLTRSQLEDLVYEEKLADEYAEYRQNKLESPKTWKQILYGLFNKLIKWLNRKSSIRGLFDKIDRGAFRNSSITLQSDILPMKAKLLPGKTAEKSRSIIATIASLIKNSKRETGSPKTIDEVIKSLEIYFDPYSKENKALIERSDEPEKLKKYLKDNHRFYFSTNVTTLDIIREEVAKYLKVLNYDPLKQDYSVHQNKETKDTKDFDILISEYNPTESVSSQIKAWIGSTIYTENHFGKEEETAVHFARVYHKMLSVLTNQSIDNVIPMLDLLGDYDKELNAVYKRLKKEFHYSDKTPNGNGLTDELFLNMFRKSFELMRIPFVNTYADENGKLKVKKTNLHDPGKFTLDSWSNDYNANLDTESRLGNNKFRNKIIDDLEDLVLKLKGLPVKSNVIEKYDTDTAVLKIMGSLGIKLSPSYVDLVFIPKEDSPSKERERQNLLTQMKGEKEEDNKVINVDDISNIMESIKRGINPYLNTGIYQRLLKIAHGSSEYSKDFIIPNYRASDGTLRYTYVPMNQFSQAIAETKEDYKFLKDIEFATQRGKYTSFNPLLNKDPKLAKQFIQNLELVFTGDNDISGRGKGATYVDSTEGQVISVLHSAFDDPVTIEGNRYYYGVPFVIADKRSFYAVRVPLRGYVTLANDKIDYTQEAKDDLKNLFTQEWKAIRGDFGEFKTKLWMYLPIFNFKTEALANIKEEGDINKYFESDILPAIKEMLDNDMSNYRNKVLSDKTSKKYVGKNINDNVYLSNFYLNNFINNISVQQLVQGDIKQVSTKEKATLLETYNATVAEAVKRNASTNAAGKNMGEGNDRLIFTEDYISYASLDNLSLITKEEFNKLPTERKKPEDRIKSDYAKVNEDDAQAWSTLSTLIKDLIHSGQTSPEEIEILKKLDGQPNENGEVIEPTDEERSKVDLISLKHVIAGDLVNGKRMYGKLSIALLTPWTFGIYDKKTGWRAREGREEGFNRWQTLRDSKADLMLPKSASKIFFGDSLNAEDFIQGSTDKAKIYESPRKNRREQVIKASKNSEKVKLLTQIQQLIDSGLEKNQANANLRRQWQDIQYTLRTRNFDFLSSQLVDENGKLKEDLSRFLQTLRDTVEDSTNDMQLVELLKDKNSFNLRQISQKVEEIYISYFKEAVQPRINGAKLTMISPIAFRPMRDKATGKVIPSDEYEANKSKYPEAYRDNLKTMWEEGGNNGEIIISKFTAKKLGLKIGDKVISLRIPTQGYNFMGYDEIVDLIGEEYGDVVIGSPQRALVAGLDYDDDSLNIFTKDFYIENGEKREYGDARTPEVKFGEFINWYANNNKDIHKEIVNLLNTPYYIKIKNYISDLKKQRKDVALLDDEIGFEEIIDLINPIRKEEREEVNIALKEQFGNLEDLKGGLIKKVFNSFSLPGSLGEWVLKGSPESIGEINNNLLGKMEEMIQKPELERYFKTPSTTEETDKTKDRINKIVENKDIIPGYSPNGLLKAIQDNMAGVNMRGSTVNAQITAASFTKNEIDLNESHYIRFNGNTYTTFNTTESENFIKSNRLSEKTSTTIDNSKDPKAAVFHWNPSSVSIFGYLNALGIPIENGDGILSVQPSIIQADKSWEIPKVLNTYLAKFEGIVEKAKDKKESIENIDRYYKILDDTKQNLSGKDLWWALEYANNKIEIKDTLSELKYLSIQIASLELYKKAADIASFAFNWTRVLGTNRELSKSLDGLKVIKESYETLINAMNIDPDDPVQPPFDPTNLLDDKNMEANMNNIVNILDISKQLFLKETNFFTEGVNNLTKHLSINPYQREKKLTKVSNSFLTYLQMKLLRNLNPNYNFNNLVIGEKDNIVDIFNKLMGFEEFSSNKFIKFIHALRPGVTGNKTGLNLLALDSTTKFDKEVNELLIDSIISLQTSENPEIVKFANETLFNYAASIWNLQFLNFSFTNKLPSNLFKPLSQKLALLNIELAKDKPSEKVVQDIIGKSFDELKDEFERNYVQNGYNSSELKNINTQTKANEGALLGWDKKTNKFVTIWETEQNETQVVFRLAKDINTSADLRENSLFNAKLIKGKIDSFNFPKYLIYNGLLYELKDKQNFAGKYVRLDQYTIKGMQPWLNSPQENVDIDKAIIKVYSTNFTGTDPGDYNDHGITEADFANNNPEGDLGIDASDFNLPNSEDFEGVDFELPNASDFEGIENFANLQENQNIIYNWDEFKNQILKKDKTMTEELWNNLSDKERLEITKCL